ncbi:MAG: hypothetical protein C4540_02330 [Candidatus Omnitrophota bacterium]|nr:MAG: hypothetical protein C4540_02330 [Candidatus Omnitrophota bacterium]
MKNNPLGKNAWLIIDSLLGMCTAASVLVLIFLMAHTSLYDLDIWLHLKTGEIIVRTHAIPVRDIFSFTVAGKPWIDHSWLFQVIVYALYSRWGADSLIFLQSTVIAGAFFILLLAGLRLARSYLEPSVFVLLAAYASLSRFNIRPEILSLFIFAGYLYILTAYTENKKIWNLVLLQIIWVNLHGYFFLGPLLVLLFLAAEFLRRALRSLPWQWGETSALSDAAYRRFQKLFLVILGAGAINPNGIRGLLYPLLVLKEALAGKTHIFLQHIQELQLTFQTIAYLQNTYFYLLMAGICGVLFAVNIKKVGIRDILLLVWFFIFSQTVRHVAFFAFVAYLFILRYLVPTITGIAFHIRLRASSRAAPYFAARYFLAVFLISIMAVRSHAMLTQRYYDFTANQFKSDLSGINASSYPQGAVDFLLAHRIHGNVFNDFDSGAYMIGRAYPHNRIFIDGRTELYGQAFFKKYLAMLNGNTLLFDKAAQGYRINIVLMSLNNRPLPRILAYLYKNPHWKLVFFDAFGVVFVRDSSSYAPFIENHTIDLKRYRPSQSDPRVLAQQQVYPTACLNRAHLFSLFGEDALAQEECLRALMIMPECAEANFLLGKTYMRKRSYKKAIYYLQKTLKIIPRHPSALAGLGVCFRETGDNKSAENILKKIRMLPSSEVERAIDPEIKERISGLL